MNDEIDPTTACFLRNLDLKIVNLTVNAENRITWLSVECRGKLQSLYSFAAEATEPEKGEPS